MSEATSDGGAPADTIVMRQMASGLGIDRNSPTWRQQIMHAAVPPAGLPTTLGSVEDVRRVCEAAELTLRSKHVDMWQDEHVNVKCSTYRGEVVIVAGSDSASWIATVELGGPTALLWHAVRAARSES